MARILVVDDEDGVRAFLAEALETEHHDVTTADGAEAARRALAAHGFDVVVSDIKMPGESGLDLLRFIRSEQPSVEVILLTAHGTVDTAVEAMRTGAFDYLQKPLSSPKELRVVVGRALERRALVAFKDSAARGGANERTLSYGAPAMKSVVDAIAKVAKTNATVLLLGESGTGKEVAARAIHAMSPRAAAPFVAINCAAVTDTLLESELFGHEKGAFTGADSQRRGRIELAAGGSFFLDEIGELKPALQSKLLRVLQERRYERVGGTRTLDADVRWIAATNRDLEGMIKDGGFREDLYHRLAVFPIRLPPLRERKEDLLPLARALLDDVGTELGKPGLALDAGAIRVLEARAWPGNVRELRNALERAAILADGTVIAAAHLDDARPASAPAGDDDVLDLDALERRAIERALGAAGGNRKQAAQLLGIGLRTLYDKLKRHGLGEH